MPRRHSCTRSVPSRDRPRVLIIEDDEGCAKALERRLRSRFQTTICHSGLEGLEVFERNVPHALVVDFELPDISGVDLSRVLSGSLLRDIPLIIVSAHDRRDIPSLRDDAIFLEKPFDAQALADMLDSLLQERAQSASTD